MMPVLDPRNAVSVVQLSVPPGSHYVDTAAELVRATVRSAWLQLAAPMAVPNTVVMRASCYHVWRRWWS